MLITKYVFSVIALLLFMGTFAFATTGMGIKNNTNTTSTINPRNNIHNVTADEFIDTKNETGSHPIEQEVKRNTNGDGVSPDSSGFRDHTSSEEGMIEPLIRGYDGRMGLLFEEDPGLFRPKRYDRGPMYDECGDIQQLGLPGVSPKCVAFTPEEQEELQKFAILISDMEGVFFRYMKKTERDHSASLENAIKERNKAKDDSEKKRCGEIIDKLNADYTKEHSGLIAYLARLDSFFHDLSYGSKRLLLASRRTDVFKTYKNNFMSYLLDDYYISCKAQLEGRKKSLN